MTRLTLSGPGYNGLPHVVLVRVTPFRCVPIRTSFKAAAWDFKVSLGDVLQNLLLDRQIGRCTPQLRFLFAAPSASRFQLQAAIFSPPVVQRLLDHPTHPCIQRHRFALAHQRFTAAVASLRFSLV